MPEGNPEPIASAIPAKLVFKGVTIASTAVGSRRDAIEVLNFASRGEIGLAAGLGQSSRVG